MSFDESYRRILHKLEYYNYQHGFIVRSLKQGAGWDDHIEKCRRFILRSLEIHKPETITVLGSGWLLELPLEELTQRTGKIYLVDIVHPPEMISQSGKMPSVNFITADITGGLIEEIWKKTSIIPFYRKLHSLEGIKIPEFHPDFEPGMVISLNLLSQLEVLPLKHLLKKARISPDELTDFRKELQNKHLDFLRKHKSVLITDVAEIFTDRSGYVEEKKSIITDLPSGIYRENWIWDFDLKRTDYNGKKSVMQVEAIIF